MAPYRIIKQGYMLKEPPPTKRGLRKKLHRYWFVMVEDKHQVALVYFKSEDSYLARHRNVGFIRVDDALTISVIGEYLGAKNAFSIITPKHKYILVPESRYDLHEWILTLHNALESFKKRKVKAQDKSAHRQRASSASSTSEAQGHRQQTSSASSTSKAHGNHQQTISPPITSEAHGHRQRASSTSSAGGAHAKTPPTTPTKTTPTRRAPPPPPTAAAPSSKQQSSPRRRPVRPAPAAPGKKAKQQESPTDESGAFGHPPAVWFHEDDLLPPGYMLASQDPSDQYGGFHYEPHPVLDLDISQTDHDYEGGRERGEQRVHLPEPLPEDEAENKEESASPVHVRSASDSLVNFHENSGSLPELRSGVTEHEKSTSPEDGSTDSDLPERKEGLSASRPSPKISHTRHLSLINHQSPVRNKKRSKRTASLKRSRSPPELPPPPPPPGQEGEASAVGVGQEQEAPADQPSGRGMKPNTSSSSIGFTEVMNTISTIEHQLDEMSPEPEPTTTAIRTPPITEAPQHVSSSPPPAESTFTPVDPAYLPPVPERPKGWEGEESEEQLDFSCLDEEGENGVGSESDEETDMAAPPVGHQRGHFDTPINLYSGEILEYPNVAGGQPLEWRTAEGAYLDPVVVPEAPGTIEQAMSNGVNGPSKAPKAKKTVMFKEEVEDIPTYEPRVDEEIPSTVAGLKMMLFGQKEAEMSRFKRGEGKRLDYYQEENPLDFEYHRDGSTSPNHNNNNSGAVLPDLTEIPEEREEETGQELTASSPELPPPDLDGEERETGELENVYDTPWDQKPASKYVSQGAMAQKLRGSSPHGQHEKLHFAEVSVHEGPIPGNSELRNVHSLERPTKQRKSASDFEGSSLLASISTTLQGTSRFGSDSLLNNISPAFQASSLATSSHTSPPLRRERQEVRSARGELEKIKAEHRRDPHYSPKTSPKSPLQQRARERTRFAQHNGHPPRMTVSLDELQLDTEVRYDSSTHAHIYRSLV